MSWAEFSFAIPYLLSLALALTLVLYGAQRSHVPVAGPLAAYALLQSIWIYGFLQEAFAITLEAKLIWDDLQFVPWILMPFFMLLASRGFVGRPVLPLRPTDWAYLVIAGVVFVAVATDSTWHGVRSDPRLIPTFPRGELTYGFPPLVYLMTAVTYVISTFVLVRLWKQAWKSTGKHRKQGLLVFVGLAIPIAAGLLTVMNVSVGFHRDIAPITFGLGDLIIVVGIFRYRILDIAPLAFETAFQAMADPIVVLDEDRAIVAHNRAYANLRGRPETNLVGQALPAPESVDLAIYDPVRIPVAVRGSRESGVIWHYRDVRTLQEAQVQQLERERLGALGRMANNLAHELNTPLASLLSASRYLQDLSHESESSEDAESLGVRLRSLVRIPDGRSGLERGRDGKLWRALFEAEGVEDAADWADKVNNAGLVPDQSAGPGTLPPGWGKTPRLAEILERVCQRATYDTCLWVIQESSERAVQIIASMQGLEHSQGGGATTVVSLQTLADNALMGLGHRGGDGLVTLELHEGGTLRGNAPRLTQMLYQLLKNAHQAGGRDGQVVLRSRIEGSKTVIEVEDTGPGISADLQKWIFSPYFTTKRAGEGSGLGLAIVKLVAKEHGAELSFESRPGRTVFRVAFAQAE